jgi:beta-lactam-binding protein with PASTA domain
MATITLLAVGAFVLFWLFGRGEKPIEPDPDVMAKAEAKCAATRARGGPIVISNPNAQEPSGRMVRTHPMRAPRWEQL